MDPLSPLMHLNRGFRFYLARRFDEANTHIRKALELDPNYPWALRLLGWSLLWKGDKASAPALMEKAQSMDAEPFSIGSFGYVLAVSGDRAKAEQILRDLENLAKQRYVSPAASMVVYLGLGEKEKALERLEKMLRGPGSAVLVSESRSRLRPPAHRAALPGAAEKGRPRQMSAATG